MEGWRPTWTLVQFYRTADERTKDRGDSIHTIALRLLSRVPSGNAATRAGVTIQAERATPGAAKGKSLSEQ